MRVIAGKFGSRQLKSLKGMALRPTSDRLRETLFNVLADRVAGASFVDVFAGTGAVGIEALSRGAREVVFIEKHGPSAALIRKNLESLGVREGVRVLALDAVHGLEVVARDKSNDDVGTDIVFLDPPYESVAEYELGLGLLGGECSQLLAENAVVIAEHSKRHDLVERYGELVQYRVLKQGDGALSFYRLDPTSQI
jgi:16S rRNA (guanine966-N2)-methyltransferase